MCSEGDGIAELDGPLHALFGKGKTKELLTFLSEDEKIKIARNAEALLLDKLIPENEHENN
jgi:hypothetical protein